MRIILLGAPGAGKGTQGKLLADHLHVPKISTGDILRAAVHTGNELGQQVKAIMERGGLVPDPLMIQIIKERLQKEDCRHGFILDGFPRTVAQAEVLRQEDVAITHVIEIVVDDAEVLKRLSGRWTHPGSGRVYHQLYNPPRVAGLDDVTGEPLVQRPDDQEETIRKRLQVYRQQTEPLVAYYKKFTQENSAVHYVSVDGCQSIESIQQKIVAKVD